MFTNLFGNFLNVHEHFKKFQWNILKCSPTNFLMNIFNNSQKNLQKISEFFLKYFFTRHFDLKCLQTCSGTFWMFKNILKSSNGTFWNVPLQISKKKFRNNLLNKSECFGTLFENLLMFRNKSECPEHFELFQKLWKFFGILWKFECF